MRWIFVAFVFFCPIVPLFAAEDQDSKLALRTAAALYEGIRTEELPNGLRIYLKPIPGSTSVTTMVVYKVGSADEDKSFTGLSHYLEHLMFKGTARLKPGDVDRITFRAGGSNNAYTNTDLTAYHFNLPAGRWKAALEVEADRMRNIRIDKDHEFDREKGAVINELIGNEDQPWDLEYKSMLPLLFGKEHPYGHPVIGEGLHVRAATEKVIKEYYDRWYHPNNANLILVGGFDADEAMTTIRKLFGSIPRGTLPARKTLPSKPAKLPVRHEMKSKFSVPRLLIGFPTVTVGSADQPALDVLDAVLSRGKQSRLYSGLMDETPVASSVSSEHMPGRYPGWLGVFIDVLPGKDRKTVEKLVLKEITLLRDEAVPADELHRVKQQLLSSAIMGKESTYALANSIGQSVTLTDLPSLRKYLPRLMAVTAADVQRVARKYLTVNRSVTVWSLPTGKTGAGIGVPAKERAKTLQRNKEIGTGGFDLKQTQRVVLPNGLVVLLFENRRLPLVEIHVSLREAGIYQADDKLGVASLTGSLLDEGTTKRTASQISQAIESVGGILTMGAGTGSVKVLTTHRKLALDLLLECLTKPAMRKEPFSRAKARLLAELGEAEVTPDVRAARAFAKLVYGNHPLGRPASGTLDSVKKLTPEDCLQFHKTVFVPNNAMLAVVGDFDSKEMLAEIRKTVAEWKKGDLPKLNLPPIQRPKEFEQTIITMPEAAQLQMLMGHIGIRRDDPDYYKLLVMDYILGTGPGFTDRISARLRDREGLAYSVSAVITTTAGIHPGIFTCSIGTENDKFARVKKLFLEELNRIRDTKPTALEVADAKAYLSGSQLLQFSTNGGIARQLLGIERYKLGFSYLDDYQKAISAVTVEDIQAMAKKHIDPKRMILVAAGAVDKKGQPLKK